MEARRFAKGTGIRIPILTAGEYELALSVLARLQHAPLGTERTEGLQDLIEAILEFEEAHGRGNGNGVGH